MLVLVIPRANSICHIMTVVGFVENENPFNFAAGCSMLIARIVDAGDDNMSHARVCIVHVFAGAD